MVALSHPQQAAEHPVIAALRDLQEATRLEEACDADMVQLPRGMFEELYPKSLPEDLSLSRIDRKVNLFCILAEHGIDMGLIARGVA